MWGAILGLPDPVPADLVALCLIAVKISREVNAPKRDNIVDMAGYAETLSLIREREEFAESVKWKAVASVSPFKTMAERSSPDICGKVYIITSAAGDEHHVCFHAPDHAGECSAILEGEDCE